MIWKPRKRSRLGIKRRRNPGPLLMVNPSKPKRKTSKGKKKMAKRGRPKKKKTTVRHVKRFFSQLASAAKYGKSKAHKKYKARRAAIRKAGGVSGLGEGLKEYVRAKRAAARKRKAAKKTYRKRGKKMAKKGKKHYKARKGMTKHQRRVAAGKKAWRTRKRQGTTGRKRGRKAGKRTKKASKKYRRRQVWLRARGVKSVYVKPRRSRRGYRFKGGYVAVRVRNRRRRVMHRRRSRRYRNPSGGGIRTRNPAIVNDVLIPVALGVVGFIGAKLLMSKLPASITSKLVIGGYNLGPVVIPLGAAALLMLVVAKKLPKFSKLAYGMGFGLAMAGGIATASMLLGKTSFGQSIGLSGYVRSVGGYRTVPMAGYIRKPLGQIERPMLSAGVTKPFGVGLPADSRSYDKFKWGGIYDQSVWE